MLPKHNFWKIFRTLVTVFITTIFGSSLSNIVLGQSKTAEKQPHQTIEERIARVQEELNYRKEKTSQESHIPTPALNSSEEEYGSFTTQTKPQWNNWNNVPQPGSPRRSSY